MLLACYVLGVTQERIGNLFGFGQSHTLAAIRVTMKRLILYRTICKPSGSIAPILKAAAVERILPVPMSRIVIALAREKSVKAVKELFGLGGDHRRGGKTCVAASTKRSCCWPTECRSRRGRRG
jgi:hypothetical protein